MSSTTKSTEPQHAADLDPGVGLFHLLKYVVSEILHFIFFHNLNFSSFSHVLIVSVICIHSYHVLSKVFLSDRKDDTVLYIKMTVA